MSNDNRPNFTAFNVRNYQRGGETQSDWTRIGVAWPHADGDGLDIILEALPVSGRITVRKNKQKAEA